MNAYEEIVKTMTELRLRVERIEKDVAIIKKTIK